MTPRPRSPAARPAPTGAAALARRALAACLLAALALPAGAAPGVVMVLGDSLSAAYGVDVERGWVALLADRLERAHPGWRVVNASVSGDTTRGALARLPRALETHRPDVVVVELGGNDGLRGLPLARTRENLESIVRASRDAGARVLLLGMRLPPNYGPSYTKQFHAVYREIAERHDVALVPFFLEGVAGERDLMQADGIHPRAEAQPRLLENVWPRLEALL